MNIPPNRNSRVFASCESIQVRPIDAGNPGEEDMNPVEEELATAMEGNGQALVRIQVANEKKGAVEPLQLGLLPFSNSDCVGQRETNLDILLDRQASESL